MDREINTIEPGLSVVVPVFNGIKYISDTLDSLECLEKMIQCEIIFQNCHSTDGTTEVLNEFCANRDNRYHFNESDRGQSDAINKGMERACGKWVTWLCADDVILPAVLDAIREGDRRKIDIVYGDVIFVSNASVTPAMGTEKYYQGVLSKKRLVIQQPGTCILRRVWKEMNGVQEHLNWAMDYDLFMRMETAGKKFYRCKEYLAIIRIHSEAKTSSPSFARFREIMSIIWQSHKRKPKYFRLKPYAIYFLEYVIKGLEVKQSGAPQRIIIKVLRKAVHGVFWIIAQPVESRDIRIRYNQLPEYIKLRLKI